jgi:hypothetical protein
VRILGVDPGPVNSAVAAWDGKAVLMAEELSNEKVFDRIRGEYVEYGSTVAIERLRGFGMTAGNEVLDTVEWVGRFQQFCIERDIVCVLIPRKTVVLALCETSRAGDKEIRAALEYRVGPIGTKRSPGSLALCPNTHTRAALAVAMTYLDSLVCGRSVRNVTVPKGLSQ